MKPLKSQKAVFLCEVNMINLRYERDLASALRLILRQTTLSLEKSCSQPQVKKTHEETTEGEGFGSLRANHEQLTVRKIVKINRKLLHPPREQVEVEAEVRRWV